MVATHEGTARSSKRRLFVLQTNTNFFVSLAFHIHDLKRAVLNSLIYNPVAT